MTNPNHSEPIPFYEAASQLLQLRQTAAAVEPISEFLKEWGNSQSGTVHHALGEICEYFGSKSLAKGYYEKALEFASNEGDGQVEAAALSGLARAVMREGNTKESHDLLQKAKDKFETLKDEEKWPELQQRVEDFSSKDEQLLFLSGCPECDPPGGGDGRWSGNPPICRGC